MQHSLPIITTPAAPSPRPGRYVIDFGNERVTGFTGRQVAQLLESEQFRHITVYRIHRIDREGRMELAGVSHSIFSLQDGLTFFRGTREVAEFDFAALTDAATREPPPAATRVQLVADDSEKSRFAVTLSFAAEAADEISAWLLRHKFQGGDTVEAGPPSIAGRVLDEKQFDSN